MSGEDLTVIGELKNESVDQKAFEASNVADNPNHLVKDGVSKIIDDAKLTLNKFKDEGNGSDNKWRESPGVFNDRFGEFIVNSNNMDRAIADISKLSLEDYAALMSFVDMEEVQFDVSYPVQKAIVEKTLSLCDEHDNNRLLVFNPLLEPRKRNGFDKENILDKTVIAMRDLCAEGKYLNQIDYLANVIGQNVHMVNPEVFYNVALDIKSLAMISDIDTRRAEDDLRLRSGVPFVYKTNNMLRNIASTLEGGMVYDMQFHGEGVFEKLNERNLGFTSKMLDIMPRIYMDAKFQSWSEDAEKRMETVVRNLSESPNYLLREKARGILPLLDQSFEEDVKRVRVKEFLNLERWKSSDLRNNHNFEVKGLNKDDYIAKGLSEGFIGIYNLDGALIGAFKPGDILKGTGVSVEMEGLRELLEKNVSLKWSGSTKDTINDFMWLSKLKTREKIENDFNIDLSRMELRAQFWFLNYIKTSSVDNFSKLIEFKNKFGMAGLNSFLSMEFGLDNGDRVLEIGERLEDKTAREVFSLYGNIIEAASKLASKYDINKKEAIFEAVLRRGKELMISASYLENSEFSDKDIVDAMKTYSNFLKGMMDGEDVALQENVNIREIYEKAKNSGENDLMGLFNAYFEAQWLKETKSEKMSDLAEYTKNFYEAYSLMNKEAAAQNADTPTEIARIGEFLRSKNVKGKVLDAGCGDGERITEPVAKENKEAQIVGIDLREVASDDKEAAYVQGDMRNMPFEEESFEAVMANWSSVADLLGRSDQISALNEFSRVLKDGGHLYLDIPYLEVSADYKKIADEYHKDHPDEPYGTIELKFDQDEQVLSKKCYLYPYYEIETLLNSIGFEITNAPSDTPSDNVETSSYWETSNGRPRLSLIAKKTGQKSSNIITSAV